MPDSIAVKEKYFMSFLELASSRYSVRKFMDKPVEQEKIDAILSAAKAAPTACNNQPQKIYVVRDPEAVERLRGVCKCTFGANLIFVVGYDENRSWKNKLMPGYESGETDAAIVCTHMMLEAWDLGIGSCWVGLFNSDEIRNALGIPEGVRITALLPAGYPAEDSAPIALHSIFRDETDMVSYI